MDSMSIPMINVEVFETERFNADNYVKKVAAENIYALSIAEHKDKLNRLAQQTAEEIKQNVYKNYGNFMETSKEVGHLEGKMNQLRQSLEEQRKLLNLFKNLNVNNTVKSLTANSPSSSANPASSSTSSLSLLLDQVEGCSLIAQKPNRNLLYHSDLEALNSDDFSVSHKLHAYLLTDSLLLTLPQRKRNKSNFNMSSTSSMTGGGGSRRNEVNSSLLSSTSSSSNNYLYKFHAFYELQEIKIINIEDSKEVRNSFQLHKFPECIAFRCANAHIKKEWLENIDNAKKQLKTSAALEASNQKRAGGGDLTSSVIEEEEEEEAEFNEEELDEEALRHKKTLSLTNLSSVSDYERGKILRELFSEFDILLAQRDFEKAVEMLRKIKNSQTTTATTNASNGGGNKGATVNTGQDPIQKLIYKQKESELINILRKDLVQSKERGNSKGVVKTGKRVVSSLIKLKIYDEAMDLFIDYHKYLNSETLRRIKLEESNQIYMNNVLNSFFDNLKQSYVSFCAQFAELLNSCFSTYLSWCDTEIEILIKKLQSQHYLGRHFDLTIENCELIFVKAKRFAEFEVKFLFETKLSQILEQAIKEQLDILIDASMQRSKLELEDSANSANYEPNRQSHVQKLLKDLETKQLLGIKFDEKDVELIKKCTLTSLQFSRGVLDFFFNVCRVYYQDINFAIVEAIVKLFKAEIKIYTIYLNKTAAANANGTMVYQINRQDIFNNVCLIERVFSVIEALYFARIGVHSKHFVKLVDKIARFKEENFVSI